MIVINTRHDIATSYMLIWTYPVIKRAEQRGIKVVHLRNQQITAYDIERRIRSINPKFIFFNGHGTSYSMVNEKWDEVIGLDNIQILKGSVTFARACDCLNGLGDAAVSNGCLAFIGYRAPFWIPRINEMETRATFDRIAGPVMDNSNIVAAELIDGCNVRTAVEKAHIAANKTINKLMYSPQYANDPEIPSTVHALMYNDEALDFVGDDYQIIK